MNEIITLKRFADIDLNDTFFNSLKEDYPGFDAWFEKKSKDNMKHMCNIQTITYKHFCI